MAELALVVSIAQLTDNICKVSKTVGEFFWAVREASENASKLHQLLTDVNSLAYSVCILDREHALSKAALHEYETLPDVVRKLTGLRDELGSLQIFVGNVSGTPYETGRRLKLGKRIKWVLHEKTLAASLGRLEQHKSTLGLFLEVLNSRISLRLRDEFSDLRGVIESNQTILQRAAEESSRAASSVTALREDFAQFSLSNDSFKAEMKASITDPHRFAILLRQQLQTILPEIIDHHITNTDKASRGWLREGMKNLPLACDRTIDNIPKAFSDDGSCYDQGDGREWKSNLLDVFEKASIVKPKDPARKRRVWTYSWGFGSLTVAISGAQGDSSSLGGKRDWFHMSLFFSLCPSLSSNGLSLSLAKSYDSRGALVLSPQINTYTVIPDDAEQFRCVCQGSVAQLQNLFSRGLASPWDQTVSGMTLLHLAVLWNSAEMCQFLLSRGADPRASACLRETPIDAICRRMFFNGNITAYKVDKAKQHFHQQTRIYRVLESHSVDLSDRSRHSWKDMLGFVPSFGNRVDNPTSQTRVELANECLSFLTAIGCNINGPDEDGRSLLSTLIEEYNCIYVSSIYAAPTTLLSLMLRCNDILDFDARDANGRNALHTCVRALSLTYDQFYLDKTSFAALIYRLRQRGCDIEGRDNQGRTPNDLAWLLGPRTLKRWRIVCDHPPTNWDLYI